MALRIGLIAARSKEDAQSLAREVRPWLIARGCTVLDEAALARGDTPDVLVTLGGDGLIMRMAHTWADVPILGINVGKIGFLAMIEREGWRAALQALIDGRYRVEDGPSLTATVQRNHRLLSAEWAINDVVIRSGMQIIEVEMYVDGQFVNTYPGDGMIVATPQGSTAYCMAAGGPILGVGVRGFAVTPICAHSPIRTTLVVPEDAVIELVKASDRDARLILDGQPQTELLEGDLVRVRGGEHRFRLVFLQGMSFYQALRDKFNFMIRPGAVPTLGKGIHTTSRD